jgi:TolB-like protein
VVAEKPPLLRYSIVVLPFVNRGGDPEQDYLAAGITDDLTTILGRLPGSFVIGRGTAATYRGRTMDVRQLGRDLGVRYAVEGSVRRLGGQVRVDAQLLDTGTGAQLWAESLEEPRADLAELSRQVMLRIARALDLQLLAAESRRLAAERPGNPEAADLVLRGRALMTTFRSRESLAEARRLFERAVALDEGSAIAHAGLASAIYDPVTFAWSKEPEADTRIAEAHVMRALAIDRDHAWARRVRGMILERKWRFEEALAEFDKVVAFDPSNVAARVRRGYVKLKTDRPAEAIADISEAMRISPRDWNLDTWHHFLGSAYLMLGRDEEALEHFLKARAANPFRQAHVFNLASGYALTGRIEEARATLEEHRRMGPTHPSASVARRSWYPDSDYPLYRATRERQIEALRRIGMPEE